MTGTTRFSLRWVPPCWLPRHLQAFNNNTPTLAHPGLPSSVLAQELGEVIAPMAALFLMFVLPSFSQEVAMKKVTDLLFAKVRKGRDGACVVQQGNR